MKLMDSFILVLHQGNGTADAHTYPDSLEWVAILFSWHVAGNFVLFIAALLATWHVARSRSPLATSLSVFTPRKNCILSCFEPLSSPSSTSSGLNSPNTVQTNASPADLKAPAHLDAKPAMMSDASLGLSTFSYMVQTKQLPALPTSAATSPNTSAGHTVVVMEDVRNNHSSDHVQFIQNATEHYLTKQAAASMSDLEDVQRNVPPVVVEAVPRDNIALSDEYRTLSREDELRASIKLKESSLI